MGDQPPGDQHDDFVDGLGHFGQQMAGDQHRATGGGVAAHEVAQPADPFGVETVGGLVQHEDLGLPEQGGGEPEPLTHAQREAADASPGDPGQGDVGEHLVDPIVGQTGGGGEDAQVLAGPAPGMEAGRLEHGADVTDRLVEVAVWLTVDGCRAGRRGDQPEQHPQGRGLPGAVGAEEPDDPAGRELAR